jgi:hypothetical protein
MCSSCCFNDTFPVFFDKGKKERAMQDEQLFQLKKLLGQVKKQR